MFFITTSLQSTATFAQADTINTANNKLLAGNLKEGTNVYLVYFTDSTFARTRRRVAGCVFKNLARSRPALQHRQFNAYLYRMAQNTAINVLRRQSREARLHLQDLENRIAIKFNANKVKTAKFNIA